MPSPTVQVKDGAGSYGPTTNGTNVTPGNTVSIQLVSQAGVTSWQISCVYTDELSVASTVTAGLTIDNLNKIATFVAPAAGRSYIFKSQVNNGINSSTGLVDPTLSYTFGTYTLTGNGYRVIAANETIESSASFGYAASYNPFVRAGGAGGAGATPWHNVPLAEKSANYTIVSADFSIVCVTNTGFTITMPAAPANGDSYEVINVAAGNNTVSGNGHNINGAATLTLVQYQSVKLRYDSTSTIWVAV